MSKPGTSGRTAGPSRPTRELAGRPPFAPCEAQALVNAVHLTEPIDHGLSGHGWTLRKLRPWVMTTFGDEVSRNTIRRALRDGGLSWKKVKKLLGKARPGRRVEHVERLAAPFEQVRRREVTLLDIDESHLHQDLDEGYTWGPKGRRAWRMSTAPGLPERLNWYGAYDFTHGRCLICEDGPCDAMAFCHFLERFLRWRSGVPGRVVIIWDNAPCHIAQMVQGHAAELGVELMALPGYSPDQNPIERLWDWMREEATRGHCHASLRALKAACLAFVAQTGADAIGIVDRLWPKFDIDPEHEAKLLVST